MAKGKKKDSDWPLEGAADEYLLSKPDGAYADRAREVLSKPKEKLGEDEIRTTLWNSRPNYHCPHCQAASLDRAWVKEHMLYRHGLYKGMVPGGVTEHY